MDLQDKVVAPEESVSKPNNDKTGEDVTGDFRKIWIEISEDPYEALIKAIKAVETAKGVTRKFKEAVLRKSIQIIKNKAGNKLPLVVSKLLDELLEVAESNKSISQALVEALEAWQKEARGKGGDDSEDENGNISEKLTKEMDHKKPEKDQYADQSEHLQEIADYNGQATPRTKLRAKL